MFDNLRYDIQRKMQLYLRKKTLMNRMKFILQQGTIAVAVYRFGNWSYRLRVPVVRRIFLFLYFILNVMVMMFTGINIQMRAEIGKGFVIHNFSGIFIPATKIGENCTVQQGVTIGHINVKGVPHRPVIGNNVFFGAGCKVLGAVNIGNNVVIGANSVVVASVPDNCTVFGVPARVVSNDATSQYLKFG